MNPLHRKLECRSDISKADLKIAYPNHITAGQSVEKVDPVTGVTPLTEVTP